MSSSISVPALSSANTAPSAGVYVPVHRRSHSPASSSRSGRSTPDSVHSDGAHQSMVSFIGQCLLNPWTHTDHPTVPVYTIADLLHLQRSPLAKLSPDAKQAMRDVVPDIVLNRKAVETRRWKARQTPSPERFNTEAPRAPLVPHHESAHHAGHVEHLPAHHHHHHYGSDWMRRRSAEHDERPRW
jgi:hypothetical protein